MKISTAMMRATAQIVKRTKPAKVFSCARISMLPGLCSAIVSLLIPRLSPNSRFIRPCHDPGAAARRPLVQIRRRSGARLAAVGSQPEADPPRLLPLRRLGKRAEHDVELRDMLDELCPRAVLVAAVEGHD